MKLFLILLLLSYSITSKAQSKKTEYHKVIFPGTSLGITLSKKFKINNSINNLKGYFDSRDSSIIMGVQTQMELTMEEVIQRQIKAINFQGLHIKKKKKFKYLNYESILIEYKDEFDTFEAMLLIFGEKNRQNFVTARFKKGRKKEIKKALRSVHLDSNNQINKNNILGFSAIESQGYLKLKSKNILQYYYESRDTKDSLNASLNLLKSTKDRFQYMNFKECTEYIELQHFPSQKTISEEIFVFDETNSSYEKILMKVLPSGLKQFDYVTVLKFEPFDIIAVGSVLNFEDIENIRKIIKSIKFK